MFSKKRLFLLTGVLLALLLVFLFLGHKENRNYDRVTSNMQNAKLDGNYIYFYTGSFFAKYDLATNQVDRLSDYLYIESGINGVSWGPAGVVFQTAPAAADRDDVTTAAANLGVKPDLPHWWRYDFFAKKYQLLYFSNIDSCETLYQVSNSLLACTKPQSLGANSYTLDLYDISSGTSSKLFASDDAINDVGSDGDSIYFVTTGLNGAQTLHSIKTSGESQQDVYAGAGEISYVLNAGDVLLDEMPAQKISSNSAVETGAEPAKIGYRVILIKNGQTKWDKKVKSLPLSLYKDTGGLMFSSLDGSINSVDDEGIHKIIGATKKALSTGDFLFKSGGPIFVLKADGSLLSTSPPSNQYKNPGDFNIAKDGDKTGKSWIDQEESGIRGVYLYLNGVSSSAQELAVGERLEKIGFRASEFNFRWVVDGTGFHVPIKPQTDILK